MIKHLELHGSIDDMVTVCVWWTWLHFIKEVRVIAYLLQLHQDIQELNAVFAAHSLHAVDISSNDCLVELLLKLSQSNEHINLLFGWQVAFHVKFEPSKHERLEKSMDLLDDLLLAFRVVFFFTAHYEKIVELVS